MEIKHFDPAAFDFGKKKAFPMRPGHFFASCEKAMTDLDWAPEYATVAGLRDSYENDFVSKKVRAPVQSRRCCLSRRKWFDTDVMIRSCRLQCCCC